jgi:sirohydrochlorin cobaltochelatase
LNAPDRLSSHATRALVLVGHGSHLSSSSSAPVYAHAERIRAAGVFDEVIEGFWKEEPSLRNVLDLTESDDVYVVPVFLAEGYFTRQVVPRELALQGERSTLDRQRIHYCRPVGAHPSMRELVLQRALATCRSGPTEARDSALVIIGHGTNRSSTSGDTVYELVDSLRSRGEFAFVTCGFLDEDPPIADIVASLRVPNVVLVPFFVAEGWHTAETIPTDLGLAGTRTERAGRTLLYSPPVGTLPEITEVILSIVGDAGAFDPRTRPGDQLGSPARPVADAKRRFFSWLDSAQKTGRDFLQINVRRSGDGRYEISHVADRDTARSLLRHETDPRAALSICRHDAGGGYRPLRTAATLKPGWLLDKLDANDLWRAVSLFYPAAVLHWHQLATGAFDSVNYGSWAGRQSGLYDGLKTLGDAHLKKVVSGCCGSCLRTRLWGFGSDTGDASDPFDSSMVAIVPCREPCTVFGTAARERLNTISSAR